MLTITLVLCAVLPSTAAAQGKPVEHPTILNQKSLSFVIDEATRLLGPTEQSIALHRIVGMDHSLAISQLSQDNRLILINPHRTLFDEFGFVDTGEFLATTLQLDARREAKTAISPSTVHVSEHGYVALTTPGVTTEGVIVAGVSTAASDPQQKVLLDLMSDGLVRYAIGQSELGQLTGVDGKAVVQASSPAEMRPGHMLINARSAADIQRAVVNSGNVVRARRLVVQSGSIRLEGEKPMEAGVKVPSRPLDHKHRDSVAGSQEVDPKRGPKSGLTSTARGSAMQSAPGHDVSRPTDSKHGRLDGRSGSHQSGLDRASAIAKKTNPNSNESAIQQTQRAKSKNTLKGKTKTHKSAPPTRAHKPAPAPLISSQGVLPEWMRYLPKIESDIDGPAIPSPPR
jgi:hypothetical protein